MPASLQFKKAAIIAAEREAAQRGLVKAAQLLIRDVRQAINREFPPASSPGEYPAKRTGNLRKEIEYWEGELVVEVGATEDADYWSDLEYGTSVMAPRPFFRPRFAAKKKEMEQVAGLELKSQFGG